MSFCRTAGITKTIEHVPKREATKLSRWCVWNFPTDHGKKSRPTYLSIINSHIYLWWTTIRVTSANVVPLAIQMGCIHFPKELFCTPVVLSRDPLTSLTYALQSQQLVVDYYSRYNEIARLYSTSSNAVINHLKSIFARHRIPQTFISDNGPQ
jgi:hypothetical protein